MKITAGPVCRLFEILFSYILKTLESTKTFASFRGQGRLNHHNNHLSHNALRKERQRDICCLSFFEAHYQIEFLSSMVT